MMDDFKRFAIYAMPEGALLETGARWLGWDSVAGKEVAQPDMPGLPRTTEEATRTPRKYGFHGTVKPPFRLAKGRSAAELERAAASFCATAQPVVIPELAVRRLGGFVAIVPGAPSSALASLAASAVRDLDRFRAAPTEAELAKRRSAGLSDMQDALLTQWGYPYVMDEFRFHLTLTGNLGPAEADVAQAVLAAHFAPVLPAPFVLDSLCLMGEDAEGRFHLVHRYPLAG